MVHKDNATPLVWITKLHTFLFEGVNKILAIFTRRGGEDDAPLIHELREADVGSVAGELQISYFARSLQPIYHLRLRSPTFQSFHTLFLGFVQPNCSQSPTGLCNKSSHKMNFPKTPYELGSNIGSLLSSRSLNHFPLLKEELFCWSSGCLKYLLEISEALVELKLGFALDSPAVQSLR